MELYDRCNAPKWLQDCMLSVELKSHANDLEGKCKVGTALHWAAKRGHTKIVTYLLNLGADKHLKTTNGETPLAVASTSDVRVILGGDANDLHEQKELPIKPHYLTNPVFPYSSRNNVNLSKTESQAEVTSRRTMPHNSNNLEMLRGNTDEEELVIKARVANAVERDFIEIEIPRKTLTFECLISMLCSELEVNRMLVYKIRKLPNTIIRKDKDVNRLTEFQELELVLTNRASSESSRNYDGPSVAPRHIDVVY